MNNLILVVIGRFLFALIFLLAAPRHFSKEGIQHASDLGVPLANILVPISGLIAILGALSIMLGYHAKWGAWLIIIFLVPVTFMMHAFWQPIHANNFHVQISMFAKNLSLMGAALLIAYFGSGPFSIDQ